MDKVTVQMTPIERKAALALFPYFSKAPFLNIILDVGSNKGEWAAILVNNVDEMHLFEPNTKLLNYTAVRFDNLINVAYSDFALYSVTQEMHFYFFTNENNGLSSLIYNQHWVDIGLPMQRGKTKAVALDEIWDRNIDFLKIDVEGADFHVMLGAERLLRERKIKFIQFENSAHLKLTHHSIDDIIDYVNRFRYTVFHFDGINFVKWKDQEAENLYIMDAEFTQDWNKEFIKNTEFLKGKVKFALEIGAFEGLTTRYICDNLLSPQFCDDEKQLGTSRMIAIDPLTDEYLPGHEDNNLFVGQHDRFIRNTRTYPVELMRMTSREAFRKQSFMDYRFDFIYIDGDHREDEVYQDAVSSFEVTRVNGHILFDDYLWRNETKKGIDKFLREYNGLYDFVVNGYQIMIKKLINKI